MPSSYDRPEVMLIKHSRTRKPIKIMDPDCAICSQPAVVQCECEAKGLDIAVRQAEQRMMTSMFNDIRTWVRGHAQDYILSYFSMLTTRRRDLHSTTITRLHERASYYYRSPPHPSDLAAAEAELKRGIDEDWKASVQRYPEVLEYFYGLVRLDLPEDEDPRVRDPPLSALRGANEAARRVRFDGGGEGRKRRERDRVVRVPAPPQRAPSRGAGGFGGGFGFAPPGF